ncbi:MAG: hypothetical protein JNM51_01880 [Bacteroidia bacterium]|nr:hypothetical protein [Bacteroidia bacterium]
MKLLIPVMLLSFFNFFNDNLDKCNGFEKYKFGTSEKLYKNLTLEIEEEDIQLYTVNSNNLNIINEVQFEYIRVTFNKNKLSAIALSTKDKTGSTFFKYLKNNYGNPIKIKNTYEWLGKNVRIVYEPYKKSEDGIIDFYSREARTLKNK